MVERKLQYETVFLDFHGTFTNNRGRLAHALDYTYRQYFGRHIRREEFLDILNRPEGTSLSDFLNSSINGHLDVEDKNLLIQTYHEWAERLYIPKHRYIIKQLYDIGATCVVITNGQQDVVENTLGRWELLDCLQGVYGRGSDTALGKNSIPKKPSVEVIDFVISDLRKRDIDIRRERTLMVGDYKDDIGAGNNAGLHTAFLITGPNQLPEYYDVRPTYALLDTSDIKSNSPWLQSETTYLFRDLPKIVTGEI